MKTSDKIARWAQKLGSSLKSMVKIAVQTRTCTVTRDATADEPLIIMGNGPSLNDTIRDHADSLAAHRLMAVNYAARAQQFYDLRPEYYVMIDPIFFTHLDHENVQELWHNLSTRVDWPMTIFLPARAKVPVDFSSHNNIRIRRINPVGVEGFDWVENAAFTAGRGMPKPRNVLIASLMVALKLGFRKIYIVGADHTWSKTLEVNEQNEVISIQPHFYKDNEAEHRHTASVYRGVHLHDIMMSFHVAFRSYFTIERYARHIGTEIYNATPGSFIDAFRRKPLPRP